MNSSERRMERERAQATLAALDAALESGRATEEGRERELGELALSLRAGAPQPSASFAAELEQRVSAGFAPTPHEHERATTSAGRSGRRPARRGLSSLGRNPAGAVAAALVAFVVAGGLLGGGAMLTGPREGAAPSTTAESQRAPEGDSGALSGEPGATGSAQPEFMGRSGEAAPDESGAPEASRSESLPELPSPGFAPGQPDRRIERTASLTLAAPEDQIDRVSDGIVATTARHRGYLVSSSTFSGEDAPAGGSFDLRVPVGELRATLSELAGLATVRAQSQTGQDLTQPVATAADRLDGARAERRSLLRRLERAERDGQARALRRQLELVSGEVRGLRSQLEALEQRTDFARVSVTVTDESSSAGAGTPSSTESALDDALRSLVAAFNFSLRALGVLLPLALGAGVAWLAFRAVRRRRRESVLG